LMGTIQGSAVGWVKNRNMIIDLKMLMNKN
jgi:hypothetical protein